MRKSWICQNPEMLCYLQNGISIECKNKYQYFLSVTATLAGQIKMFFGGAINHLHSKLWLLMSDVRWFLVAVSSRQLGDTQCACTLFRRPPHSSASSYANKTTLCVDFGLVVGGLLRCSVTNRLDLLINRSALLITHPAVACLSGTHCKYRHSTAEFCLTRCRWDNICSPRHTNWQF